MSEDFYQLAAHSYSCKSAQPLAENIVLLHGWGCDSDSWLSLIPELENIADVIAFDLPGFGGSDPLSEFSLHTVLPLIVNQLPEKCVLIGWSLGGMLAIQLAKRYPKKVAKIITLAANVKFVADENYQSAMPLAINREFNKSFSENSQTTLKLFGGLLAQGDINERALLKKVRSFIKSEIINANWLQALELLAQMDNQDAFAQLTQQGLHLLAEKDALVPIAAYQSMVSLNRGQQIKVISGAAHAMHCSNPELVIRFITDFLSQTLQPIDKKQIAHSFSRAAHTYDSVASLQRYAGELLFQLIDKEIQADVVLDVGCGTGHFTPQLQNRFPAASVIGVDIAEGMLQFANEHHSSQKNWVCADVDFLPFASGSVDVIFSNFAFQWCTNLPHLFAELHRVLKPGGQCIFTSLGLATLHELKAAWAQVDAHVHVNQFHESTMLLTCLQQANFQLVRFKNTIEVMEFENLSDLTRSLKYLGAQNLNRGRSAGLTGRKKIQAFKQAYEDFRNNNGLPATYDIFYLKVKK